MGIGYAITCTGCNLHASALAGSGFDMRYSNVMVACDSCRTVSTETVRTNFESDFLDQLYAASDEEEGLADVPLQGEDLHCSECNGVLRHIAPSEFDPYWEPGLPHEPEPLPTTAGPECRCPACGGVLLRAASLYFD